MATNEQISWTAPGPGPWEIEGAHFPRPIPYFGRDTFRSSFTKGFAAGTARYGLLLSHFEAEFVNGFWYQQPAAFGAPKGAKGPPPNAILWLLTRLHPATRARIKVCEDAFANKIWRDDLKQWDEVDKPAAMKRHRELLAIDVPGLDDAALGAHLREVDAHLGEMVILHHRYTITCTLPVGDLLVHVSDWTGDPPGAILAMLRGSTPVSNGILASELEELAVALRAAPDAAALLDGRDPAAAIEALSARTDAVGVAARAFFEGIRHRSVSYEIAAKSAGEMPQMLVGSVRSAVGKSSRAGADESKKRIEAIRARIPAQHHGTFDALLAEARTINRLRDERGIYSDGFAVGIARRAVLEAGRRLVKASHLHDAEHAVDLTTDEAIGLLTGKPGPGADVVRGRVEWRLTKSVADAPPFLGGQPAGPPDPSILPPAARRAARVIDAVLSNLFKEGTAKSTETIIRGISVNEGVYEGTARLIADPSEFDRLKQGDVLVTRATAPYFNVVLPLLGAIVTDRGGQLCHAAIVAREYGIPGVVGTREATQRIPDGARVRVDGTKGEIHVLSAPA
jgi:rifampicin phosphotransferase